MMMIDDEHHSGRWIAIGRNRAGGNRAIGQNRAIGHNRAIGQITQSGSDPAKIKLRAVVMDVAMILSARKTINFVNLSG